MGQQKENIWVDEVMGSLKGIRPVADPDGVYEGVMERIRQGKAAGSRILPRVAVAAALLLSINVASVYKMSQNTGKQHSGQEAISQIIDEQITNLDSY